MYYSTIIVNLYNVEDGRIFDPNCRLYDRSCGRTFQLYKSLIKIVPVFLYYIRTNKVVQNTMYRVYTKYTIYLLPCK